MPSSRRTAASLDRYLPWLLVAVLATLQALALPGQYLGREHDDVQYVLVARSLLRGRFSLGISPGDPVFPNNTPGFPVLLMPAALLGGDSPWPYHAEAWAFLVLADALVWLWLRRRWEAPKAALGTALFALNPLVLQRAGVVMSEVASLDATLALLLAMESPAWPAWGSGALLAAAWLVRPAAVALMPAVWLAYALKRRWRDAAASAAVPLAAMGAWQLWSARYGLVLPKVEQISWVYGSGLADVLRAALSNAAYYPTLWGATWLPRPPVAGTAAAAVGALLALFVFRGAALAWRRGGWSPALGWLFFGSLMHLLWPWQYERYLLPLLPFLNEALMDGLEDAAAAAGRRPWACRALGGALLAAFLAQGCRLLSFRAKAEGPERSGTYAWVRAHAGASEAFASTFYGTDAWYTGRPFAPLPPATSAAGLAGFLRGHRISWVLLEDTRAVPSSLGERFYAVRDFERLKSIVSGPPFRLEYADPAEGTAVYRLPPPADRPD